MLEYCACCQAYAPAWDDPGYGDWHVALTPDGELLGVVCGACHIDDELAFLGFAVAAAPQQDDLAQRRRAAAERRRAGGPPSRRAA
jgi:hypothetical protein